MLFVRIGKYALDLHACVFTQARTENTNVKGIHVQNPVESFTIWSDKQPEVYADLKVYVMAMPTLGEINAEREAFEINGEEIEHNWEAEAQEATYISDVEQRYYQCDEDEPEFVPDEEEPDVSGEEWEDKEFQRAELEASGFIL